MICESEAVEILQGAFKLIRPSERHQAQCRQQDKIVESDDPELAAATRPRTNRIVARVRAMPTQLSKRPLWLARRMAAGGHVFFFAAE